MNLRVEIYSGHKADERPIRFQLGERKLEVAQVLDRWYGPDHTYFKIVAGDGNTYILRHREHAPGEDEWSLTSYRSGHESGSGEPGA